MDKDLLRLTMIPRHFLMFVGMIYNIREEEIHCLRVNQRYARIWGNHVFCQPGMERTHIWRQAATPWYWMRESINL